MKTAISAMVSVLFVFESPVFAQNASPTAEECVRLYPCTPAKARHIKRTRVNRQKQVPTNPEVLRRIDELERREREQPLLQVVPDTTERDTPHAEPPVIRNYITVQASRAPSEVQTKNVRFGLEIGGLASVHSSWWETSPGFYGAARLKLKHLVVSVESGYQRTIFQDGSVVEDVYIEPTLGYELGRGNLRFTLSGGLGFWTTLEDWITPICGRSTCGGENENALTVSVEPGLTVSVVKNLEFSLGMPVRWVSSTPDRDEWTLGIRAGVGVFLPYK